MSKELLTDNQAIPILILFLSTTSKAFMGALTAKGDFWEAIILATLIAIFTSFIFISLNKNFSGKNFFEILEICFGKFLGKIFIILYIYFVFEEASFVLINTKQSVTEINFPETPQIAIVIPLMILCVWASKNGLKLIGNLSRLYFPIFIFSTLIIILVLIPKMELINLEPILYEGVTPLVRGTLEAFTFTFGEIVILNLVFSNFKTRKSPFRIYIFGLLISMIILLTVSFTTILVLGVELSQNLYYPIYTVTTKATLGAILERLEIVSLIISIIGAFIKNSIFIIAVSMGISKLFNTKDYKFIIVPVALIMINYSSFLLNSTMEFSKYNSNVWIYYAIVFEFFIPIVVFIISKFKRKKYFKIV